MIKIEQKCCDKEYKICQFVKHLKEKHNIDFLSYLKSLNVIPVCPICGKDAQYKRGLTFNKFCSRECYLIYNKNSEEKRKKISSKMKIAHKEKRHCGWSFINENISRRSYPETYFYNILKIYKLFDEFTIIEKYPFGGYFLDFAIINLKIDLEIDGQMHFRNESAIEHDKKETNF